MKVDSKPPDIQRIAREYLKRFLEGDMEQRVTSPHQPVYSSNYEGNASTADLKWVEAELQTAKTELHERLYDHQGPLIDEVMEEYGVSSQLRKPLADAILQSRVKIWETIRQCTLGDFGSD